MCLQFMGFSIQPLILFFSFVWVPRGPSEVMLAPENRVHFSCGSVSATLYPFSPALRTSPLPQSDSICPAGLSRSDCSDGLLAISLPKLMLGVSQGVA